MQKNRNNSIVSGEILTQNLHQKYGVQPVHTLSEIELLHNRFPNNIALYVAKQQNEVLAGIVLYLINDVAHVQYISASNEGKAIGALDLLFHEVIHQKLKDYAYFDFGRLLRIMDYFLTNRLCIRKKVSVEELCVGTNTNGHYDLNI